MKAWTIRTPLEANETYVMRLQAACERVTEEQCLRYVQHTKKYWLKCVKEEDITQGE